MNKGEKNHKSMSEISHGDYTEIVAHALSDCASAVPVAGAFITATANVGLNMAAAKQTGRIVHVLEALAQRVDNIEQQFKQRCEDDGFLILFYKLLFWTRDEINPDKTEAYIRFGQKLLTENIPYDGTVVALNIMAEMTGHELKVLKIITAVASRDFIKRQDFESNKSYQAEIGTPMPEDIHSILVALMQKGLIIVTQYGAILGEIENSSFEKFRLSKTGTLLAALVF